MASNIRWSTVDEYTHFMYIDGEVTGYVMLDLEEEYWYVIYCNGDPMFAADTDEAIIATFYDLSQAQDFLEEGFSTYANTK